jgi:hypothetical protein
MGMDVYGNNPTGKVGEYFRRNVWGWHPLWSYVEDVYPEIAELVEHAHSNDGDGLGAADSLKLSSLLMHDYKSGKAEEYVQKRLRAIAALPLEDCTLCQNTGIRSDEIGKANGMPEKELSDDLKIITGRTHGWCNACSGSGHKEPWEANYYLEADDILEFAEFLEACGGFEIC